MSGTVRNAGATKTDRIGSDAVRGYCPPGFVIDRTLAQMAALRDADPDRSALIAPAAARAAKSGLKDLTPDAAAIFRSRVAPALDRQKAALEALRVKAGTEGGVWRHPDGDAWYAYALAANMTVEIDRYCVYPGQACSFKVGANAIVAAREAARRRLGARFDVRRFHAVILNAGPVPMGVLSAALADWDGA